MSNYIVINMFNVFNNKLFNNDFLFWDVLIKFVLLLKIKWSIIVIFKKIVNIMIE